MRRIASYMMLLFLANILTNVANAQNNTVGGKIINRTNKESISAASVTIKGGSVGTFTDDKGNFKLSFPQKYPVTLMVSSVGYALQEVVVNEATETLSIEMTTSNSLGQEVVVSASRVPQSIMESPVSIERVSASNIRNAPAANFYDVVRSH
jgi:hypothetical protein